MIDRAEFLRMCQKCAMYEDDVGGVKKNLPKEMYVYYCGVKYYPLGYIMRFDRTGNPINNALLHDSKSNSTVECNLQKIEMSENDGRKEV